MAAEASASLPSSSPPAVDWSRQCQEVAPRVFLGPISAATDAAYLQELGITHRVTCLGDALEPLPGVTSLHVRVLDNNVDDIERHFAPSTAFIRDALAADAANRVLVHCSSGASRSTTITAAYMLASGHGTLRDVLLAISGRRPVVLPATTFYQALRALDASLHQPPVCDADDRLYNILQCRAVTGRPLARCTEAVDRAGGDVSQAIFALFSMEDDQQPPPPDAHPAEDSVLMFAYGTLMRGYGNHDNLMQGIELVGEYQTVRKYAMYEAGVPFVHPDRPRTIILGELYRVPMSRLPALDQLEGHPDCYCRMLVPVVPRSGGDEVQAWLYFNSFAYDPAETRHGDSTDGIPANFVSSGDFRQVCPVDD